MIKPKWNIYFTLHLFKVKDLLDKEAGKHKGNFSGYKRAAIHRISQQLQKHTHTKYMWMTEKVEVDLRSWGME